MTYALRYGDFVEFRSFTSHRSCFVNLAQVRKYEYLNDGEKVKVCWANGDEEVLAIEDLIGPEKYYIIPAQSGFELLVLYMDDIKNGKEFTLDRSPVVSWRINEDQTGKRYVDESLIAIAITGTSHDDASNVRVGVRCPDGQVMIYQDARHFESVEKWREWAEEDRGMETQADDSGRVNPHERTTNE
jgi:hypothetical protein